MRHFQHNMYPLGCYVLSFLSIIAMCKGEREFDITGNEQSVIKALVERMNDMETREASHTKALEKLKREHQLEIDQLKRELEKQNDKLNILLMKSNGQARLLSKIMRRAQPRSMTTAKKSVSLPSTAISVASDEIEDEKQTMLFERTDKQIHRAKKNELRVAFTAGLTHIVHHAGPHQNIVFDNVETNFGNGYNPLQGVFTAPISGLYLFYSSILNSDEVWCQIVVNGRNIASIYARGIDGFYDQGSQAVIVNLRQGDTVSVQNLVSGHSIFGDSNFYSTFSGVLLSLI